MYFLFISKIVNFSGWDPLDGLSWSEYGTEEHPQRGRYLHNINNMYRVNVYFIFVLVIFFYINRFVVGTFENLDQKVTCTWMHDPDNGYNDTMVWIPANIMDCTGQLKFII